MTQTAYFDDSGAPQLRQSYCVYADFLGFKQEILEAISKGEEHLVFNRFMEQIEPEIDEIINPGPNDESDKFPRMWDAKVLTDNVVLGYALWSDRGEKEFGHAIGQLIEFQFAVALKGFFVRGGWAVGNLFMNRNTVFGGSLLEAYELESKQAEMPRILLSDAMKERVLKHMARYAEDPPQIYHVLVDEKERLFTNYLYEALEYGLRLDQLQQHADLISKRMEKHRGQDRVLSKYQWLASYHNFFCDNFLADHSNVRELYVSGEFPISSMRRLTHDESPYVMEAKEELRVRQEKLAALRARKGN